MLACLCCSVSVLGLGGFCYKFLLLVIIVNSVVHSSSNRCLCFAYCLFLLVIVAFLVCWIHWFVWWELVLTASLGLVVDYGGLGLGSFLRVSLWFGVGVVYCFWFLLLWRWGVLWCKWCFVLVVGYGFAGSWVCGFVGGTSFVSLCGDDWSFGVV